MDENRLDTGGYAGNFKWSRVAIGIVRGQIADFDTTIGVVGLWSVPRETKGPHGTNKRSSVQTNLDGYPIRYRVYSVKEYGVRLWNPNKSG